MSIENLYRESLLAGHAARVYELADSTNTRLKELFVFGSCLV